MASSAAAKIKESNKEILLEDNNDPRILAGSFFQPSLAMNWTASDFAAEYEAMKEVGMDHIIWQWTVDTKEKQACYPTEMPGYSQIFNQDAVNLSLEQAEKQGLKVWLGLNANDDWFGYYANDENWLANEVSFNKKIVQELWQRYGGRYGGTIAGFYIWMEVDNLHFQERKKQNRMAAVYKEIAETIHGTTGKPMMIAPFFTQGIGQDAVQYADMWGTILKTAPIDIIALQDGIGADHVTLEEIGGWLALLKAKVNEVRPETKLWSDLETFTPELLSAPISRIIGQINAQRKYVSNFTSFSFNHYDSPNSGHMIPYFKYKEYVKSLR